MSNTIPLPESLTSDQEKALLAEAKTGPFRHTTPSYGNDMQSGETPRLSSKRHAGSTPPTAPAPVVLLPEPDCRLPMDGPPRYRADQMHAHAAAVSAAKDAEIAALRAENDKLREALAQKVVSQTMLTGLVVQDGGLTIGLEGGAAGLLVEMFAQQFKDGGGTNYLQLSFTSSVCLPGEAFIVTVQKCAGKTPHQLRMDAETEAAALRAEVAGLREDAERLDFLLHKLPGDALRYVLGELSDTSNGAEFRAAIDAARKGEA